MNPFTWFFVRRGELNAAVQLAAEEELAAQIWRGLYYSLADDNKKLRAEVQRLRGHNGEIPL